MGMRAIVTSIPASFRFWALLVCGTALYFFANIQRVAIPGSVFDCLQQELKVSAPCITALGSSFMYTYAFSQLAIGLLVDRYGGHRIIAFGAILFCAGSLLFPLVHSLPALYLTRALTGLGASAFYLSLVKETMRSFNKNFTIMLSVVIFIGYTGGIVANAPLVHYVALTSWRHVMLATAFSTLGFYLLYLLAYAGAAPYPVQPIPFSLAPMRTVMAKRHNRHTFLFCGINFGLYYVIQTVIGKKFLEDYCQFTNAQAAGVLSLTGMISAVSGLGLAVASRLSGNRRQIFVRFVGLSCLFVFVMLTVLLLLEVRTAWIAGLLCLLAFTASTSSIVVPLLRETNVVEYTGVSVSLLNFSCYITVAVLGNAVGLLMNLYKPEQHGAILLYGTPSYVAVFGTMLGLSGVVAWCAFQLRETRGEYLADSTL